MIRRILEDRTLNHGTIVKQQIINNSRPVPITHLPHILKREMFQTPRIKEIILQMRVISSLEILAGQTIRTVSCGHVYHVIPVIIDHPHFHGIPQNGKTTLFQKVFQNERIHGIRDHIQTCFPVTVFPKNDPTASQ